MHPIVAFVNVLGASTLRVAPGGVWFCKMITQGCFAILGGMTDVGPVSVAVVLDLPPILFALVPVGFLGVGVVTDGS